MAMVKMVKRRSNGLVGGISNTSTDASRLSFAFHMHFEFFSKHQEFSQTLCFDNQLTKLIVKVDVVDAHNEVLRKPYAGSLIGRMMVPCIGFRKYRGWSHFQPPRR